MIPISLSLSNFLSYGESPPALDFTTFHVACISGQNGHGKSALLDAMTWALWGEARKSSAERKPDDGLLRIGATEMQVVFIFALENDRYRVSRSYRKTARSGSSSLELQVFDPESGAFRALTEESSLRKTQDRLNGLLRMSYDTFINSAFILQGQADEFTRRNARERKTILAEILGLSRYDELAALARAHVQETEVDASQARQHLAEIEQAAAEKPELLKNLETSSTHLEVLEKEISAAERHLETLRENQARTKAKEQELAGLKEEWTRLESDQKTATTEANTAQKELDACHEILLKKEEILAAVEQRKTLQGEETQLQQKLHRLRDLEKQQSDLEKQITQARHEVERRLGEWELRVSEAERELREIDEILIRREEIETGTKELALAREQEHQFEETREKKETLERHIRELERAYEAARADIHVALNTRRERQQHLEAVAGEEPTLLKNTQEANLRLEQAQELERQRDRVREEGASLKSREENARQRIEELQKEVDRVARQRSALEELQEAQCPLCGTNLDDQHREEVRVQLDEQMQRQQASIQALEEEAENAASEREIYRRNYQDLKNRLAAIEDAASNAARAEAALKMAAQAAQDLERVHQEVAGLETRASEIQTNSKEARVLAEARKELEALLYDPDNHRILRKRLQDLSMIETRLAQLQTAEARREKIQHTLPEARDKRDTARTWLTEKRYARPAQEELTALQLELENLNYDAQQHTHVTQSLENLSDVEGRKERLQSAQREMDSAQTRLQAANKRLQDNASRLERVNLRVSELEPDVRETESLPEQIAQNQEQLKNQRAERDRLFQKRAVLQTRLERCETFEAARQEEQDRLNRAEKEIRTYRELVIAFGKDGIQALIIEQAIPEIEEEANRILSRLTENRTQISLESLKDLKKGGSRETLDIQISDELGERRYELYSGGEAFRVDFSLRIALSKLLARRAGTRLRTLVIDEGFGTQDAEGLEHLVEAIQAISEDFEKILVITHVEALKQAFPVRIEVTKYPDTGSVFQVLH
ncbi:MAG: AAA family ATPase [bacterium]|nr:AAA family ATPase [bacterium]